MACFTITRHIGAPRDKVFACLSDFRRAPERIKGIKKVEMLTDGPVGVGTRFRETRIVFKREASEVMEVTAFNPPIGYTLACNSCGCRYESEFRLTPRGAGTDVEMRFAVQPLTLFAKVMGSLMRPMFKMCLTEMGKDLDDLKASIEGDVRPAGVG
jgi:carbon monoxide dehydrogenase subunit G